MATSPARVPLLLADLSKLLDGYVARSEHHEDLEVRYIVWLASVIGALIAGGAALLSPSSKVPILAVHVLLLDCAQLGV
jgi:hypothetical protein